MFDLTMPMHLWVIAVALSGLLGLFLSVLLFRSACDLVSVEPPDWLKSTGIVLLLDLLTAPLGFGVNFGAVAFGKALNLSPELTIGLAILVALPFNAVLAALLYMFLLRVHFLRGAFIWVLQSLMGLLVGSVAVLLVIGVWTIVDGVRRVL